MLKPAILYKEEIIKKFREYYYTEDMFLECGDLGNWTPDIVDNPKEGTYNYAIVDPKDETKLVGYIGFKVDFYCSQAYNFGIISFDRGNYLVSVDLKHIMDMLIKEFKLHRIEWRMVGGNPVESHYDKFCNRYNGNKYVLHDVLKDKSGQYRNSVIYEIILSKEGD